MLQLDNYVFKGRYEDILGTAMIFQHDKGTKFSCQKIEFCSICHCLTSLRRKIASSQRPGCGRSQSRDHRVGAIIGPIIGPIKYKTLLNGVHLTMHLIHLN